jgi:hypothetical protein
MSLSWSEPPVGVPFQEVAVCRDATGKKKGIVYYVPDEETWGSSVRSAGTSATPNTGLAAKPATGKAPNARAFARYIKNGPIFGGAAASRPAPEGAPSGLEDELMTLPGCKLEPVPVVVDEHGKPAREVIAVSGPSGAGKSHFLRMYAHNYICMTSNPVFLLSALESDTTLDAMRPPPNRLDTKKLVVDPDALNIKKWENSLVLVDDIEGAPKLIKEGLIAIQDLIATTGRHEAVSLIRSSHLSTAGMQSRLLLGEVQGVVVYPQMGAHKQITYLLHHYMGVEMGVVRQLLKTKSRWLYVHASIPRFAMTETSIALM